MRWLGTLAAVGIGWLALAGPADAVQLRGATLTPNWSVRESRMHMSPDEQRGEIAAVAAMGGNVVRMDLDWARLQGDDGRIDSAYQAQLDRAIASAAEYRQAVILNIIGTPCWAAAAPDCPTRPRNHIDPPRPEAFAEVTRYLLNRYPSLYAYEVWNEPNFSGFWNGTTVQFAQIVNAAVAGRNAVGSQTRVIIGGFLLDGSAYLEQLYQAGMRGQDGISIHPYSMIPASKADPWGQWEEPTQRYSPFRMAIQTAHQTMIRHGDRGGLYLTEFGYSSCPSFPCLPAEQAGQWLASSYRVAARYRYVKALTAFSMRDYADPADPYAPWTMRSGILGRPAFGNIHVALKQLRSKKYLRKHGYLGKKRKHKRKKT